MKYDPPYAEHLAFKSNRFFARTNVLDFNEAYSALKRGKETKFSFSEINSKEKKCIDNLNNAFKVLLESAIDHRERLFLTELRFESLRILEEDFGVYRQRNERLSNAVEKDTFDLQKYVCGKISDNSLLEINKRVSGLVKKFKRKAEEGRRTREDLSANTGLIVRSVVSILNKEFKANGVLDKISSYMGDNYLVTGLAVELSVPNSGWWNVDYQVYNRQPDTLYYHFDESLALPKAIVYLNDVERGNGGTACSPGLRAALNITEFQFLIGRAILCVGKTKGSELISYYNHKYHQTFGCPIFRSDFSRLPEELRFSSHFGWDVIPDSELEKYILKDEVEVVGPAGTFIVFDGGELAHRGGLLKENYRLALQVVFGKRHTVATRVMNKIKRLF